MKNDYRPIILFVGPLPPPWFGQAIGMQVLLEAPQLRACYRLLHVNTNNVGKSGMRRILSTIRSLLEYAGKLVAYRPKIVYLMVTRSKLGCIKDCVVMLLARLWRAPVVVHLRGGDLDVFHKSLGPFWKGVVRHAYGTVSVGIVLGDSLRSQFDGLLPAERVRVILNCWHDGGTEFLVCRAERPTEAPLRLAFVSNVLPSKGLHDALEGVARAVQEGVKLEFRFAGQFLNHDGAIAKLPELVHENLPARVLEQRYEELVEALGIKEHVFRLGVVRGREKWDLLSQTDVLLLPIYNPTEGQPLVAIEAMRAGCVIISTQCGGLVDIVEDGATGRVVPPRKPEEIGETIKWFWNHPGELERIGRNNMKRADELHNPETHVRRILNVFDEAVRYSR